MIYPSMPQGCLKNLAESHDFLMHGVARWGLAAHSLALFEPMDAILVDLARRNLRKDHGPKERN
jgi:hypothetical protein